MQPFLLLFLSSLLLLSLHPTPAHSECFNYTGSICASVITYPVYALSQEQLNQVEGTLTSQFILLTTFGSMVDPPCVEAALQFFCSLNFPRCLNQTVGLPPCRPLCERVNGECRDIFEVVQMEGVIPDCDAAPTSDCVSLQASSDDELFAGFECPSPLILNPYPENPAISCIGYCCIPCPYGDYFYHEGVARKLDKFKLGVTVITFFSACFVFITYVLMPEKRSYPSFIITCIAASLVIYNTGPMINLGGFDQVRCNNEVDMAMPGNNDNMRCKVQSTFGFYGILAAALWFLMMVVNVYENVIFLTTRLARVKYLTFPICFLPPLIPVIILFANGDKSGYTFGLACTADVGKFVNGAILIPLAFIIFPSVLLNLHIVVKIAWVAKQRNATVMSIVQLQIRLFVFVMFVLTVFLFYWAYFVLKLKDLTFDAKSEWLREWFFCILQGAGQNACASNAVGHVPPLSGFAFADFLVCTLGILVISFFGIRKEVYLFWKDVLMGDYKRFVEPESLRMTRSNSIQMSRSPSLGKISVGVQKEDSQKDLQKEDPRKEGV